MKPINQEVRQKAFMSFLLFFLVTIALIIAVVFFSVQVPFKQNERLQAEVADIEIEKSMGERFSNKLTETMGYFESVNKPGFQSEMIHDQISKNLSAMGEMVKVDSSRFGGLYLNMISILYDYQGAKKTLRVTSEYESKIAAMQGELTQCLSALETLRTENAILRQARR